MTPSGRSGHSCAASMPRWHALPVLSASSSGCARLSCSRCVLDKPRIIILDTGCAVTTHEHQALHGSASSALVAPCLELGADLWRWPRKAVVSLQRALELSEASLGIHHVETVVSL